MRLQDAYKTFSHMTSPYVYPVGGFGSSLPKYAFPWQLVVAVAVGLGGDLHADVHVLMPVRAIAEVLEENDGYQIVDRPVDRVLFDERRARTSQCETPHGELSCGCKHTASPCEGARLPWVSETVSPDVCAFACGAVARRAASSVTELR